MNGEMGNLVPVLKGLSHCFLRSVGERAGSGPGRRAMEWAVFAVGCVGRGRDSGHHALVLTITRPPAAKHGKATAAQVSPFYWHAAFIKKEWRR